MKILDKIVNIVQDKPLTSIEIAAKVKIPKSNCQVYLHTLLKQGRIKRTTKKKPYKYKISDRRDIKNEKIKFDRNGKMLPSRIGYKLKPKKIPKGLSKIEKFERERAEILGKIKLEIDNVFELRRWKQIYLKNLKKT